MEILFEDKISKLSDDLINHVLSFLLTVDVVPTCLLSKRWKNIWHLVSTLSFSDDRMPNFENFCNYVDNCLEHRKRGMANDNSVLIKSFKLQIMDFDPRNNAHYIDKWLDFVVENKINELYIYLNPEEVEDEDDDDYGELLYYCLPQTMLLNARNITVLDLHGIEILDNATNYRINFPSLKSLKMKNFRMHNAVLFNFVLGCPLLERLILIEYINSGDNLCLVSSRLKYMKLKGANNVQLLQIKAENIEYLEIVDVPFDGGEFSLGKNIPKGNFHSYTSKCIILQKNMNKTIII
ncbi:FBD-associated F-box protein At5g44490-like [Cannabis sativa]|uniref:FBD-associated F-box protein At5g44490-like n=1 Tax=Cannabis sativa TaxID=3483 RepID=UPI0029C9B622|nr:FBD-associated F-box protein At5g44490-like [Cannabis sativa]XP_030490451.2 FBD-associated F-box protein At5g44490-like [Cannabis sativa]XP_060963393.1 FBD-associated F-box protein At5g44490-like [Cannabis sativa]